MFTVPAVGRRGNRGGSYPFPTPGKRQGLSWWARLLRPWQPGEAGTATSRPMPPACAGRDPVCAEQRTARSVHGQADRDGPGPEDLVHGGEQPEGHHEETVGLTQY